MLKPHFMHSPNHHSFSLPSPGAMRGAHKAAHARLGPPSLRTKLPVATWTAHEATKPKIDRVETSLWLSRHRRRRRPGLLGTGGRPEFLRSSAEDDQPTNWPGQGSEQGTCASCRLGSLEELMDGFRGC